MGTQLSEAHTGYRAYSRRLLLTVPFLRNSPDFTFDSELLMQASHFGLRISEVPARGRYFEDASSVGLGSGDRLRPEDALDRNSPCAAPSASRPVTEVQAPDGEDRPELSPAVTGERVVTSARRLQSRPGSATLPPMRSSEPFLAPGRVLDLGCGVGHSYRLLAPRETVGVDIDAEALARPGAGDRGRRHARAALPDRESFDGAIAVHSIEHVPDPERALAEVARVLKPGGPAVLVTPNRLTFARADEIIDPYHYVEYDRAELAALCEGVLRERRDGWALRLGALPGARGARAREARPSAPAGSAAPETPAAARGAPGALRPTPEA